MSEYRRQRSIVLSVLVFVLAAPAPALATPFFARRTEYDCNNCHQGHFPRLNALGRRFRDNGYQLPDGASEVIRARRNVEPGTTGSKTSVFKEVPLSVRGQVFGVGAFTSDPAPYDASVFAYLMGGGSVTDNVSAYFSYTPFPMSMVHKFHLGAHNIGESVLGAGTLNLRAGLLMLLDRQRPSHRFLSPSRNPVVGLTVGLNRFAFNTVQPGVQAYGQPGWGPFFYEVALVGGDPGATELGDRDAWKDVWVRTGWTLFQYTDHEVTPAVFAYVGRSIIEEDLGGIDLVLQDDFAIVGGDIEADFGDFNVQAMGFYRTHSDATVAGGRVSAIGIRGELLWLLHRNWIASVRYGHVLSADDSSLEAIQVTPHVTWLPAGNVQVSLAFRTNVLDVDQSTLVLVLDTVF